MKHRPAENLRVQLPHAASAPGISQALLCFLLMRGETGQPGEHRQLESLR